MPDRMRIIDAHTHIAAEKAQTAVRIMDAAGVEAAVVCEWHDGFGQTLQQHLREFARFEGRFFVFGNIDFSAIAAPDFAARAVEDLRRGVEAGMRGLKVYKNLGLELTDASGELLRVDDERLDPIWAAAGELGIPVLLHTADPRAFWQPIDRHNPWGAILRHWPEWSYYRKGLPSRDELLAERNALLRRHPETSFIAPHLGSLEDDFGSLSETLQALPNLHVDIAARFYHMAATGPRREAARKLCTEFADRILFGTDLILLSDTAEADIQPQTFLTPERLPERFAGCGQEMLLATSVWFYEFHKAFLETGRTQRPIPFLCNDPATALAGLDLPKTVLQKLYHGNIERLLGRQPQG
jgi:predicted TIM-barrel fold metal-dependent hydrolase